MKSCYIMIGVPGSGKSTVAKTLTARIEENNSPIKAVTFSLDECRLEFLGEHIEDPKKAYSLAFQKANDDKQGFDALVATNWKKALSADLLFVDNTNLTVKSRAKWVQDARARGFTVAAINVIIPLQLAIERQATRGDKEVPAQIIKDMYMRIQEPTVDECDFIMNVLGF